MYECNKCGFKTIEENKICPLCEGDVEKLNAVDSIIPNYMDPDIILNNNKEVSFSYYCYKCKKHSQKKVCLDCNIIGYLSINYKQKRYILNRISKLSDVYTDYEVNDILENTDDIEKNYIYHNLSEPSRFFYRKDKSKSNTSYFFAIFLYLLGFIISTNAYDQEMIIPYFANAFSNTLFVLLIFTGFWYSKNAYEFEEKKIPAKFAIIGLACSFTYVIISLILTLNFINSFLLGIAFMAANIVMNYVYYKKVRKSK